MTATNVACTDYNCIVGHNLPSYAGNLYIMTSAALGAAEQVVAARGAA